MRTREAGTLTDELPSYELRVDEGARENFGAFGVAESDPSVQ